MLNSELVALALTKRGAPYSTTNRFGPVTYDCSGLIHACLSLGGVDDRGAAGWTSRTFQDWIMGAGATSSLAVARGTAGMIVTLGHTDGPHGHIGLTAGDNHVIETPSAEGHQVGVSPFDRNRWDFAGFIPGVNYGAAPSPMPKPTTATEEDEVLLIHVAPDGDFPGALLLDTGDKLRALPDLAHVAELEKFGGVPRTITLNRPQLEQYLKPEAAVPGVNWPAG